jgi:hypothetical protein
MSTVGYGDFSPTTPGSQAFTIFYIFVGVVVVFSSITRAMDILLHPLMDRLRNVLGWLFPEKLIDIDGNDKADYKVPRPVYFFYTLKMLPNVLINLCVQLAFSEMFVQQEDWDYQTALYHCLVTATTVGYGDTSIKTRGGQWVAICHILVSVCLLGDTISEMDTSREERRHELQRYSLLQKKLDKDLILSLDQDGKGVDKTEFVIGMLTKLGLVDQDDVTPFITQFHALDKSSDGRLTREDLEEVADSFKARVTSREYSRHHSFHPSHALPGLRLAGGTLFHSEAKVSPTVDVTDESSAPDVTDVSMEDPLPEAQGTALRAAGQGDVLD